VEDNVVELPLLGGRLQPYGTEPILPKLELPREDVTSKEYVPHILPFRDYSSGKGGPELPPNTVAFPDRWRVPLPHWQRYLDPSTETPYFNEKPKLWHPYHQSLLKGDLPVYGQDIFTNITAKSFTVAEFRKLPVPSGVSTVRPNSAEFFGRSEQAFLSTDTSVAVDLFQWRTAFKPVSWLIPRQRRSKRELDLGQGKHLLHPDPRGSGYPGFRRTTTHGNHPVSFRSYKQHKPCGRKSRKFSRAPASPRTILTLISTINSVAGTDKPVTRIARKMCCRCKRRF